MEPAPQPSSSSASTTSSDLSGYRVVNMNLLGDMFRELLCPKCKTPSIDLQVKPARGSGTMARYGGYVQRQLELANKQWRHQ